MADPLPELGNASVGNYHLLILSKGKDSLTASTRKRFYFFRKTINYKIFKQGDVYMPIVNLSLQVLPNVSTERTYEVVDEAIKVIQESGVKYIVGPLETTMEGELDLLLEIVKKAQESCIQAGAARVMSIIKIDYRPEGVTIEEKIHKYRHIERKDK